MQCEYKKQTEHDRTAVAGKVVQAQNKGFSIPKIHSTERASEYCFQILERNGTDHGILIDLVALESNEHHQHLYLRKRKRKEPGVTPQEYYLDRICYLLEKRPFFYRIGTTQQAFFSFAEKGRDPHLRGE